MYTPTSFSFSLAGLRFSHTYVTHTQYLEETHPKIISLWCHNLPEYSLLKHVNLTHISVSLSLLNVLFLCFPLFS